MLFLYVQTTNAVRYVWVDILTPCRLVNSDISGERAASTFSVSHCMIMVIAVADFITVFYSQPYIALFAGLSILVLSCQFLFYIAGNADC